MLNNTEIEATISRDRLSVYRTRGNTQKDIHCKYLWNICLCESLYPTLNFLEISVRNAISGAMTRQFGPSWFDNQRLPLNDWQKKEIRKANEQIVKSKKSLIPGRVVAELNFGFWTSMFSSHLDRTWRSELKRSFPYAPAHLRTATHMRTTLVLIRQFRNRVFHHERILHCEPYVRWKQAREIISWISQSSLDLLNMVDRFPQVNSNGLKELRVKYFV